MNDFKNEPLVSMENYGFLIEPAYFNQGISPNRDILIRRGVAERFVAAREKLPKGYNFKIWDAYRKTAVQKRLYDDLYKKLEQDNPGWDEARLHAKTREFVAPPTIDPEKAAPHNTGATADLTIVDAEGNELPMGTGFDHFDVESYTFHFEKAAPGTKESEWHKNRMLLYETLIGDGFFNFPDEWWHYSFGDYWWAQHYCKEALYPSAEI